MSAEQSDTFRDSACGRFVGGEVWEARPEVQERVRVRREEECEVSSSSTLHTILAY